MRNVLTFGSIICFLPLMGQAELDAFARNPNLTGASISAVVFDTETGENLASINPDQRLCPASVWKLFTTLACLQTLGPNFRFRTVLAHSGLIENGILHGDLIVLGSGDPSFGSKHFKPGFEAIFYQWAEQVRASGIDSIAGDVVVNAAFLEGDGMPGTRTWEDMGNYYGTSSFGFNIHDNLYSIELSVPKLPAQAVTIASVSPEVPGLDLHSHVQSSELTGDRAYIFGAPLEGHREIRGTLPAGVQGYTIKGSIPNPPLFGAYHLQQALNKKGIGSKGYKAVFEPVRELADLKKITEHYSPELIDLINHINTKSDNLFAEALLVQLGANAGKANPQGGLDALDAILRSIVGVDYPFYGYDGSGLSRYSAVSARQIGNLLVYADQSEDLKVNFNSSLPVAGQTGTMKWFGQGSAIDGKFRAKTGTMDKVKAYAGYLTTDSGRCLAVVVMVNNFDSEPSQLKNDLEKLILDLYNTY